MLNFDNWRKAIKKGFNMRKNFLWMITILTIMYGCGTTSAEEQIHQHLTKAIKMEESFQEQQLKITELETEEQEIYNQIVAQNAAEDKRKLQELSEQAVRSINERAKEVEVEKESIEASRKEFKNIKDLLPDIEEPKAREKAEEMYSKMFRRYEAYDSLYATYQNTLELEKELYTMLMEDPDQKQLTAHIQKINESYEKVLNANEQFNLYTIEYNELKDDFYETANLEEMNHKET